MRIGTTTRGIMIFGTLAWAAQAAEGERTLRFAYIQEPQQRAQVNSAIQLLAAPEACRLDTAAGTIRINGTATQAEMGEWLFRTLDRPASATGMSAEYRVPGSADETVRVFRLANTETPQGAQEIINTIRSLADMQRVAGIYETRAIALRGSNNQVAAAEWLVARLDKPAPATAGVEELQMKDQLAPAVRVFYTQRTQTPQSLQEIMNALRSITEIQRAMVCNGPKALVVRGTADQAAAAEWLVKQLQTPGSQGTFRMNGAREMVARVFYPANVTTPATLAQTVNTLRAKTGLQRVMGVTATNAIVLRGTSQQEEQAEQLLREMANK